MESMSRVIHITWLAIALACGTALADGEIRWAPDVATARRAAAQFEVPLMIHFYGDNCLPCKTLEQRVFNQATVVTTLNKYFICVRVNASVERGTAAEYQVHSWPTDVFVSPDGQVLYQGVCKQDISGYMDVLQHVAVSNRDRNVMLAAQRSAQSNAPAEMATSSGANPTGPFTILASHAQPAAAGSATQGSPAAGAPSGNTAPTSTSPASQIQSGPLSVAQQPTSLASSAPKDLLQIQSPHSGQMNRSNEGLPPLPGHTNALGANGYNSPNRDAFKEQVGLPKIAPATSAAPPTTQNLTSQGVAAKMVSNPYFKSAEPAYCSPDGKCYTAAGEPIGPTPASTPQPAQPQAAALGEPVNNNSLLAYPPLPSQQQLSNAPAITPQLSTGLVQPSLPTFQSKTNTLVSTTTAVDEPSVSSMSTTGDSETPAIDGYCPIALNSTGSWVPGNKTYAVRHRGRVYWLQSEAAAEQFIAAPDKYSPILSGYDPMIFLERGTLVEGSLQYGLHDSVSGGVLFFSTAESKQAFESEPERHSRALSYVLRAAQK